MLSHIFDVLSCPGVWNVDDLLEWLFLAILLKKQTTNQTKNITACPCMLNLLLVCGFIFPLCQLTALKKTLKLKAEEAAKEKEKQPSAETSADKLRKILKEEKR